MIDPRAATRFLATRHDQLNDEELLELLLSYSSPQGEEKAKALLADFGNMANLLDASQQEIPKNVFLEAGDLGLIRLVTELMRRYFLIRSDRGECLTTNISVRNFLMRRFLEENCPPGIYALCLSGGQYFAGFHLLLPVEQRISDLSVSQLAEVALRHQSEHLYLATYRPEGPPEIEPKELSAFLDLSRVLQNLGISLRDSILLTDSTFLSCREFVA